MFTQIFTDTDLNEIAEVRDADDGHLFITVQRGRYATGNFFTEDEAADLLAALLSHGVRLNDRSKMLLQNSGELV